MKKGILDRIEQSVKTEKTSLYYVENYYETEGIFSGLFDLDTKILEKTIVPGSIFDATMGRGRHLVYFAQKGIVIAGNDYNPNMVEIVRKELQQVGVVAPLYNYNLLELKGVADQSFDNVICMYSSLGCVPGCQNRLLAMREMARVLRPGGVLVVHAHNRWDCSGIFFRQLFGSIKLSWFNYPLESGDWLFEHDGLGETYNHLFSSREFCSLFKRAGLRVINKIYLNSDQDQIIGGFFKNLRSGGFIFVGEKVR